MVGPACRGLPGGTVVFGLKRQIGTFSPRGRKRSRPVGLISPCIAPSLRLCAYVTECYTFLVFQDRVAITQLFGAERFVASFRRQRSRPV